MPALKLVPYTQPENTSPPPKKEGFWKHPYFGVVLVTLLVAVTSLYLKFGNRTAYGADGCLLDEPEKAHTVFMIDLSSPFSSHQTEALGTTLKEIARTLPPNERISIFVFPADNGELQRVASFCSPGFPSEEKKAVDPDAAASQTVLMNAFIHSLESKTSPYLNGRETDHSPIMEATSKIVQAKDFPPSLEKRRLVLFSDMVQNVGSYSHLNKSTGKDPLGEKIFFAHGGGHFQKFAQDRAYYGNLNVAIYYLHQSYARGIQTNGHIRFWKRYFNELGVNDVEIVFP